MSSNQPDFSRRSYEKELLDLGDIPFTDVERNMQELDTINTWLGGHAISIRGLKDLVGDRQRVSICEIGCGGGDNLRVLSRWCKKRGIEVEVVGIDINESCVRVARERWGDGQAQWIHSDYKKVVFGRKPDILFSSLFCHHFTDEELVEMLRWMDQNTGGGWFINDLHRHRLAWWSIRLLTRWFSRSYLVKNDAPLSVQRGFSRREWKKLLRESGREKYSLRWMWAFRWLVEAKV
ncbi:MAG: methyltransferase domain-containing protein [Bacteroidetes bacterium]|nr:methyltransferase domain-containing protein [Bacteroidota bacterium]